MTDGTLTRMYSSRIDEPYSCSFLDFYQYYNNLKVVLKVEVT